MHKLGSLVFCVLSVHLVNGQFSLGGSGDSSSYPRIKLAGPLGQLIGGQGISLNSGLGQVLSSIISSASNGGSSSSSSGGPLSQLATAASTQYINAIRSLPAFNQFAGNQQGQSHGPAHGQFNGQQSGHGLYNNGMQNPLNFMSADNNNLYGGQHNFDNAPSGGHFGQNAFQHFPAESK